MNPGQSMSSGARYRHPQARATRIRPWGSVPSAGRSARGTPPRVGMNSCW